MLKDGECTGIVFVGKLSYFFGYKTGFGECVVFVGKLSYFFGYKTEFFLPKQSEKSGSMDPSCKMDLDLRDCSGSVKLV